MQTSRANLANQKSFSSLDFKEAFYAVSMSPQSVPKSAVTAPWGLYEYLRTNLDLKDSMNVYCKMISSVLGYMKPNEI